MLVFGFVVLKFDEEYQEGEKGKYFLAIFFLTVNVIRASINGVVKDEKATSIWPFLTQPTPKLKPQQNNPCQKLPIISEFSKSNEVTKHIGDINILQFTDSLVKSVDTSSKEHPVCKSGKVTHLPDTAMMAYKIMGKTMYQWDPKDVDSSDRIITLLTNLTGKKIRTWNLSGIGQIPVDITVEPELLAHLDSALERQRSLLKVSGTSTISATQFHNNIEIGVCMGPLLASVLASGPIIAISKSCTEVEMKYGKETAQ